jgi:hypothetical protein
LFKRNHATDEAVFHLFLETTLKPNQSEWNVASKKAPKGQLQSFPQCNRLTMLQVFAAAGIKKPQKSDLFALSGQLFGHFECNDATKRSTTDAIVAPPCGAASCLYVN